MNGPKKCTGFRLWAAARICIIRCWVNRIFLSNSIESCCFCKCTTQWLLIYVKIFVSVAIEGGKSEGGRRESVPTHYHRLIFSAWNRIFQAIASPVKKKWSKYEDQVHTIRLIYMNWAGSRIVFNNNSPTCNALQMTASSVLVAANVRCTVRNIRIQWRARNHAPYTWTNEHWIIIKMRMYVTLVSVCLFTFAAMPWFGSTFAVAIAFIHGKTEKLWQPATRYYFDYLVRFQ